jgi:hypothetical protein
MRKTKVFISSVIGDYEDRREQNGETYSHSSYFKSAQCRIDYNTVAGISETYNLIEKLHRI